MTENGEGRGRATDGSGPAWGSDLVADLLAACGVEFVAFTPGSSFRGLEESIVNYRGNDPRVIETPHEGLSVSIAHGYAKATGEPAVCVLHDVVGTLHGAMNLFNAYCDRVPVLALAGAGPARTGDRRPYYDWIHTATHQGGLVSGYTKWDDEPTEIADVPGSLLRALRIAETPPKGPTYVALDHAVQETPLEEPIGLPDPAGFAPPAGPGPDPDAIETLADRIVDADRPVIVTDTAGTSREASAALVSLAETLGAAVVNSHRVGTPHRFNLPNIHPLDLTGTDVVEEADAVLALDAFDAEYTLSETDSITRETRDRLPADATYVEIGAAPLRTGGVGGDEFAMRATDLAIAADAALAIPALRDAVDERLRGDEAATRRRDERLETLAARHDATREAWAEEAEAAWDETPVSLPRLAGELRDVVEGEDWVLVNGTLRGWAYRLWELDDWDQYVGGYSGGGGIGYGIGGAIGGALAYEGERIPINLQPDGDLMFYPGGLWTISHYGLPILTVMHNNRSLYNSTNHRMRLAAHRDRDDSLERALVGTGLDAPVPDYAAMAESMGMTGFGPVEDPDDLAETLESAWETVRGGDPALVDVVCQPR